MYLVSFNDFLNLFGVVYFLNLVSFPAGLDASTQHPIGLLSCHYPVLKDPCFASS